jgi:hypothetical protein
MSSVTTRGPTRPPMPMAEMSCILRTRIVRHCIVMWCQPRILTSSHGQTMRKLPSFVLTWISTPPTWVIVPAREATRSLSPIWNFT